MVLFDKWCEERSESVKDHTLRIFTSSNDDAAAGCGLVASVVPDHYVAPEQIAGVFEKLGKEKAAEFVRIHLPRTKQIRSGDLGEILATEYIGGYTDFVAPIKRLRWKDHREMAMRGDDVIGLACPEAQGPVRFLKAEAKSRASLSAAVVSEAREALDKDNGLPSPHALSFVAARLSETGQSELADRIILAQLSEGITPGHVEHLFFAFCGNVPEKLLKTDLEGYGGQIRQNATALIVPGHGDFIAAVYETAGGGDDA